MGLLDLKIYLGKNKKSSKRVTLKQLIEQAIKEGHDKNNVKQETKSDSFADVSASWINLRYKNLRTKKCHNIVLSFDPENDTLIEMVDVHKSNIRIVVDNDSKKIV